MEDCSVMSTSKLMRAWPLSYFWSPRLLLT